MYKGPKELWRTRWLGFEPFPLWKSTVFFTNVDSFILCRTHALVKKQKLVFVEGKGFPSANIFPKNVSFFGWLTLSLQHWTAIGKRDEINYKNCLWVKNKIFGVKLFRKQFIDKIGVNPNPNIYSKCVSETPSKIYSFQYWAELNEKKKRKTQYKYKLFCSAMIHQKEISQVKMFNPNL